MRIPILPSRVTVDGLDRAPHRAFLRALGLSDADLGKPFVGCDKTLPGMMMAMTRLNLPSVFVYGGAALPGKWRGRDVTVLDTYEAVGAVMAGKLKESELAELEQACLPTLGSCPGQFT